MISSFVTSTAIKYLSWIQPHIASYGITLYALIFKVIKIKFTNFVVT